MKYKATVDRVAVTVSTYAITVILSLFLTVKTQTTMKYYSIFSFLLFALSANLFTAAKAQVNKSDSLALVDLYNSTNGPGWYGKSNWLTTNPVSTWAGITVTGTRVTAIKLTNNHLTGTLPASIGNLTGLISLQLFGNEITGSIPLSIGNLINLKTLYLFSNQLSGAIPVSIGNLTKLTVIYLSINNLTGEIPDALSNLVNLDSLILEDNQLTGSLPSSLGNLHNLRVLDIGINQLTGEIPSFIGNLTNLRNLRLVLNQLNGAIPASIGNLTNLGSLNLTSNQLSGSIPASIGNLKNLSDLTLNNNLLTGSIPPEMGKLKNLFFLFLDNNFLTGEIPSTFSRLNNVGRITLNNNRLTQSKNVKFPGYPKSDSRVNISSNNFTFDGLEFIDRKYPNAFYAPQSTIHIHQQANSLSVFAGGTLSNNTYNWFKVGEEGSTAITGDSIFTPTQSGKYYESVTNAIATQLTLYSDTIDFTMSSFIANNRIATRTNFGKGKQTLKVFPNPASAVIQVQINGTANIIITNAAGKIMLSKTITSNTSIDVSRFANGVYYIQNKTTGEIQKIVVIH